VKRILVVDDERPVALFMVATLQESHQVELARNGAEALACLERNVPDAIVTDLMMPGLDGTGLIEACRANPRTAFIPIVLVSAGYEVHERARAAGANASLQKPFSVEELRRVLENVLSQVG
jgi:CheY-like chemotaxis protein